MQRSQERTSNPDTDYFSCKAALTYSRDRECFMRAESAHAVGWGKLAGNER
jgi:hypothetical protein